MNARQGGVRISGPRQRPRLQDAEGDQDTHQNREQNRQVHQMLFDSLAVPVVVRSLVAGLSPTRRTEEKCR